MTPTPTVSEEAVEAAIAARRSATGDERAQMRAALLAAAPLIRGEEREAFDMRAFGRENRARCESSDGFAHALASWSLSDWMTATLGELGEAANVAKKLNRVRDGIPGNAEPPEQLRANLADEIADAFIYMDLMSQSEGIDLASAVRSKFDRTSKKIGYIAIRSRTIGGEK